MHSGTTAMNIAVVGLWHLGTVTAACLASAGHTVTGFDDNLETIDGLQRGQIPVFEPGLEDLVRREVERGRLAFSSNSADLTPAEIIWLTYDTPVDETDRADVEYVIQRVANLFPFVSEGALILISSQLPVGSTQRLEELYRRLRPDGTATFAYSPENLRLGKAIEVFTKPERVVVGMRTEKDRTRIELLLRTFTERIEWMSVESAEMTKHALNAFLATSVVFINELSTLCEQVGADAREVERGLKSDARIGSKAYLRPGKAFEGGTLARDVRFLTEIGRTKSTVTHLCSSVLRSNEAHRQWPHRRLVEIFGTLQGRSIAILGLTYKPGTDTLRRSSAVETCRWLHERGAHVAAYDPVIQALPAELTDCMCLRPSVEMTLRGADAVLIATEWPEFRSISANDVVEWMTQPNVLDPGHFLETNMAMDKRIRYFAVGRAAYA